MAKLEQGILGAFRGKVGTVVGYRWRGVPVVRAYRREINYPNTVKQQAERQWFVEMVRFASSARQALLLGLRETAATWHMTEGNAFVKMNKGCFSRTDLASPPAPLPRERGVDSVGGVGVDYEKIRISEGPAAPVRFTVAGIDENNVLRVEYERNGGAARAKGADRVYVYIYNIDTREGLLSAPAERRAGRLALQLPTGWTARNTRLWGFAVDTQGRASHSAYIDLGEDAEASEVAGNETDRISFPIRSPKTEEALKSSASSTPGGT